jgi:Protein of unknown function (DUF3501)/HIT domain
MRPLAPDEIVGLEEYEALRDAYRDRVIAYKRGRRLALGDRVTLVFEDRETVRFQVQEMLRVERIESPALVQAELDVYNELIPAQGELSATLLIEITETAHIRPELDRLIGLDEHVALALGEGADAEAVRARFDPKQLEEERIAAVQYIRFGLDEAQARRFADPAVPAAIEVDHPSYRQRAPLPPGLREQLQRDLVGEPAPLLRAGSRPAAAERELFRSGRVRVLRPGRPVAPGHVVVEALEPSASLLDAKPDLLAELLEAVQRAAREVTAQHGSCRVCADAGRDVRGLRWHVHARR